MAQPQGVPLRCSRSSGQPDRHRSTTCSHAASRFRGLGSLQRRKTQRGAAAVRRFVPTTLSQPNPPLGTTSCSRTIDDRTAPPMVRRGDPARALAAPALLRSSNLRRYSSSIEALGCDGASGEGAANAFRRRAAARRVHGVDERVVDDRQRVRRYGIVSAQASVPRSTNDDPWPPR